VKGTRLSYLDGAMGKHLVSVLTSINAPYSEQLDGAALAHCLSDIELAKQFPGQVSSFLGEVDLTKQAAFAAEFGISMDELKTFAAQFSAWSGERNLLAA